MITKTWRTDHQCLKLGLIEACIDTRGFYSHDVMTRIFGNHDKDASRILKRYRKVFPENLVKQGNHYIPENTWSRGVLKENTNAWEYLSMLEIIHGVGK